MRADEAPRIENRGDGVRIWRDLGVHTGKSIGEQIDDNSARFGASEIVFCSKERQDRHTVAELLDRTTSVQHGLLRLGLQPGDRMAVMLPNGEPCLLLYLAAMRVGITVVPIVPIYGASEVEFILRDADARVLVCPDRSRRKEYLPIIEHCRAEGLLDTVVVVGDRIAAGAVTWDELRADAPPAEPSRKARGDDLSFIIYTSGTTSRPKGVRHTHDTMNYEFASQAWEREPGERSLANMPAGHMAGLLQVMYPFYWGGAVCILEEWDAELAARLIEERGLTSSGGTPFHFNQVMDAADRLDLALPSLRMWVCGATAVPPSVVRRGDERGVAVCRCYGSSEHPTISQNFTHDPRDKRINTDGNIMRDVSVRLVTEDGEDVPPGEVGHILSRGPDLFVGYTDERVNEQSFVDGWFRTGDVGRLDADGYLAITDRHKDIVIRGGENISSSEVEEALLTHPAVRDAAVVPCPDDLMGERVCAFVVLQPGRTFTVDDALGHFVQLGLAKQKSPERLFVLDVLPRSAIGKVNKTLLKAQVRGEVEAQLP